MKQILLITLFFILIGDAFSQEDISANKVNTNYLFLGRIEGDKEPDSYWPKVSRIEYSGHNLTVGSIKGSYAHNTLLLKPGGSSLGEIYSALEIFRAVEENNHIRAIRLTAEKNRSNFINNGGNLGVGTSDPQSTLDVRGKIIANEVEIKINTGADFVFSPDYKLKPLSELEAFVNENKHLPEIPSEKQMQENGLNLNEMQIKLLQKIEELTLYLIEQNKKIESQENKISSLEQELITLKK